MRLAGKVAIVTGGASGMGRCEAVMFAREGAAVVVVDMLEADGRKVAEEITGAGGKDQFVRLDVTSEREWEAAVAEATRAFGKRSFRWPQVA